MNFKKVTKKLLTIAAAAVGIILVSYGLFMGVYHYTSRPEFCSKCHYIKPYITSWENTPHKNVNCLECHEPSGPLGKLHSKSRGLNYYLMDKTCDYSTALIKAPYINEQNCFACHMGENEDYPNTAKLNQSNFDHIKSIKNDQSCISCHRNVGHATDIKVENKVKE